MKRGLFINDVCIQILTKTFKFRTSCINKSKDPAIFIQKFSSTKNSLNFSNLTGLSNQTMSFIADRPENLIEQGFLRKIPILIGFTDMEDAYDLFAEDMVTKGIDLDM